METAAVPNIPFDESAGEHSVPFCGTFYIEREDFQESPVKGEPMRFCLQQSFHSFAGFFPRCWVALLPFDQVSVVSRLTKPWL